MMKIWRVAAVLAGCIAWPVPALWAGSDVPALPAHIPQDLFADAPRGPYRTGTSEALWIDASRDETQTRDPGDKRRLMIQVWYPAVFADDAPRAPYLLSPELFTGGEEPPPYLQAASALTRSVRDAGVAPASSPFPVLLFNHGAGFPHFTSTFLTEFMASHGYVVVSIGHTGGSGQRRFPDGYVFEADVELPPDPDEIVYLGDIRFVLDRLESMNADPGDRFRGRLDLSRVGSLGWSYGGAASIQASRDEPRVKAASNLDGLMWHRSVSRTGTPRPVMMWGCCVEKFPNQDLTRAQLGVHAAAAESDVERECIQSLAGGGDWYWIGGLPAEHGSFSDLPLFYREDDPVKRASEQDRHRRIHAFINEMNLEFFDRYLRGKTEAPLLDRQRVPAEFPKFMLTRSAER